MLSRLRIAAAVFGGLAIAAGLGGHPAGNASAQVAPPASTPTSLEISGVEHEPDARTVTVRLRIAGSRDAVLEQPSLLVDTLPVALASPTASATRSRPAVLLAIDTSG